MHQARLVDEPDAVHQLGKQRGCLGLCEHAAAGVQVVQQVHAFHELPLRREERKEDKIWAAR